MQQFVYGHSQFGKAVVDEYIASLHGAEKAAVQHVYDVAHQLVPDAEQAVYYGMPCLKYKGKGLVSVMATRKFLSLYPFGAVERLDLDLSAFEGTKGSIHFGPGHPIPDETIRAILSARLQQIDG